MIDKKKKYCKYCGTRISKPQSAQKYHKKCSKLVKIEDNKKYQQSEKGKETRKKAVRKMILKERLGRRKRKLAWMSLSDKEQLNLMLMLMGAKFSPRTLERLNKPLSDKVKQKDAIEEVVIK